MVGIQEKQIAWSLGGDGMNLAFTLSVTGSQSNIFSSGMACFSLYFNSITDNSITLESNFYGV